MTKRVRSPIAGLSERVQSVPARVWASARRFFQPPIQSNARTHRNPKALRAKRSAIRIAGTGYLDLQITKILNFSSWLCLTLGRQTSECYRRLIRTGLAACFADPIRVGRVAAATRGVSVGTVVSRRGDHHAVAVNVDIRQTCPAPGEVHRVPTLYCSHTH